VVDGALALTDAERKLFGVHQRDDTLVLRPSGWMQLGAAAQIAIALAFLALLDRLGARRQLLVGVAAACAVVVMALFQGLGTVVADRQGITMWWFGRRRIPWDQVGSLAVGSHAPWWGGGWPPFDVVDVTLRDGSRVTLWPTRSGPPPAEGRPSIAAVQCGLLERYRATLPA
jgi:hypothetical protein